MIEGNRKYIYNEIFQQRLKEQEEGDSDKRVMYELIISCIALTDEEEAKLKDILREAAEKANAFLGW